MKPRFFLKNYQVLGAMVLAILLASCAHTPKEDQPGEPSSRKVEPVKREKGPALALQSDAVRSVQLYGKTQESLPIVSLSSTDPLTLEFDLMGTSGRVLSIYFYHTDRSWERDRLVPIEYLTGFSSDDLSDYAPSRFTKVEYFHYSYQFPNRTVGFKVSGNYILRVTEKGREDEVLFERPFYVTEQAVDARFGIENVMISGFGFPFQQPVLLFTPLEARFGSVFDYNACFVRNGRLDQTLCSERPSLMYQPQILFELQPDRAFEPVSADYYLDMRSLRVGGRFVSVDFSKEPVQGELTTDYASFPASKFDPVLNAQPVFDEDTDADYAEVVFSFVPPDEKPLPQGVFLIGSFNGWRYDLGNRLKWLEDRGRYETTLLLKEGQYEYRYGAPGEIRARNAATLLPRTSNQYVALVYLYDIGLNSDRLLAASTTTTF